jgi:hypothetical protein
MGISSQVVSRLTIISSLEDDKPTKLTEYQAAWVRLHPVTHQIQGLLLPILPGINFNENKQRLSYGQGIKMVNARQTVESPSKVSLKSHSVLNPSMPEVCAQCTQQKTNNLNGHPLLCTFSDDEFR